MRTWVSFQATFPQFTVLGEFPGYEIATHLAQCLRACSIPTTEPETIEGYSYDFDCQMPERCMNVILHHVQNDLREWLIIIRPCESEPVRLGKVAAGSADYILTNQINQLLHADSRFGSIRWYTAESWENDPYEGWTVAP